MRFPSLLENYLSFKNKITHVKNKIMVHLVYSQRKHHYYTENNSKICTLYTPHIWGEN